MDNLDLQFFQKELDRVIGWVKFSHRKTAVMGAYYSAITGLVFSQKESIAKNLLNFDSSRYFSTFHCMLVLCMVIFLVIGVWFLFKSIYPNLGKPHANKSLFYFKDIADMNFKDYCKRINKLNPDQAKAEVIDQIYINSIVVTHKMNAIQNSISSFFGLAFVVIIYLISF